MGSHNDTQKSLQSPVPANIIVQGAIPGTTPTDGPFEDLQTGENLIHRQEEFNGPRGQATIDKLPDDVFLETFDFYLADKNLDQWHILVHVCRRWRNIVFASPRRLDLRLVCRNDRPVRAMLDIWPALPINVKDVSAESWETELDNLIAALEHPDRVRSISLIHVPSPQPLVAAMQVRFPELTELRFWNYGPLLSDSFLGGSAPRLRTLWLRNVEFPATRTLILSARDLVDLRLDNIPHSGYISPTSVVNCVSSLNKLESLSLGFRSRQSRPDQPSPPPQSRVVLPALIRLVFNGTSEYSEDLVAHIDTPVLNRLQVTFFPNDVFFDVRRLREFISRTKGLKVSKAAELGISSLSTHLDLQQPHSLMLGVRCRKFNWEIPSLTLLCGQFSHLFSFVERLDLQFVGRGPTTKGIIECTTFLQFLRLFPATQSLCVRKDLALLIPFVLRELVGTRTTEVLPNLHDLLFEARPTLTAIQPFVDARRLVGQPVAVHYFEETQKVDR